MTVHEPYRNIVIMNGDRLHLLKTSGPIVDRPSGDVIWDPSSETETLFVVSCTYVRNGSIAGQLHAWDCLNAALVNSSALKDNFTLAQLLSAYHNPATSRRLPSTTGLASIPLENDLIIYNRSRLLVNLEVP